MRAACLATAAVLVLLVPASARTRATTREYTPPPESGDIFTVIDFPSAHGEAQPISVSEAIGNRHRDLSAVSRYSCANVTPNGVVVRFRHYASDTAPLTLTTTGSIVRGPYQGDLPPEALHSCYRLIS